MPHTAEHTAQMPRGVADALECHHVCEETISYCLQRGGKHADAAHIKLLTDCSDICRMVADFMVRGSQFHTVVCGICADVCQACATDCERFGDDEQICRCAQACRECAGTCRQTATVSA